MKHSWLKFSLFFFCFVDTVRLMYDCALVAVESSERQDSEDVAKGNTISNIIY